MKKIAILGDAGSYSDLAYKKYNENESALLEPLYFPLIDNVIDALDDECDYAVVPLENSIDGYIQLHMDLILQSDATINDEVIIPIHFDFISNFDNTPEAHTIIGQYAVFGQCHEFLKAQKKVIFEYTKSNTETVELFLKSQTNTSAIVPNHLTSLCTYRSIQKNIADEEQNFTRFVIISKRHKKETITNGLVKVAFVVMPKKDYPGLLFEILEKIANEHINLISIMSRPTKIHFGSYNFFFEMISPRSGQDKIENVLQIIAREYPIKILGIYKKAI